MIMYKQALKKTLLKIPASGQVKLYFIQNQVILPQVFKASEQLPIKQAIEVFAD